MPSLSLIGKETESRAGGWAPRAKTLDVGSWLVVSQRCRPRGGEGGWTPRSTNADAAFWTRHDRLPRVPHRAARSPTVPCSRPSQRSGGKSESRPPDRATTRIQRCHTCLWLGFFSALGADARICGYVRRTESPDTHTSSWTTASASASPPPRDKTSNRGSPWSCQAAYVHPSVRLAVSSCPHILALHVADSCQHMRIGHPSLAPRARIGTWVSGLLGSCPSSVPPAVVYHPVSQDLVSLVFCALALTAVCFFASTAVPSDIWTQQPGPCHLPPRLFLV